MKTLILTLLLAISPAFAEHRDGNGGDGVILSDGTVVLFDLFEHGMNADALDWLPSFFPDAFLDTNARNIFGCPSSPDVDPCYEELRLALSKIFRRLAVSDLSLRQKLIFRISQLKWIPAGANLVPNVDTNPFLDFTGLTRIGCAKNINGNVYVSPDCRGPKMSPMNKAALVVHEALYSLMREYNPNMQDSYDVRMVMSKLFAPNYNPYFPPDTVSYFIMMSDSGRMIDNRVRDRKTLTAFFGDEWNLHRHMSCTFPTAPAQWQQISLEYRGMIVNGYIGDPNDGDCSRMFYSESGTRGSCSASNSSEAYENAWRAFSITLGYNDSTNQAISHFYMTSKKGIDYPYEFVDFFIYSDGKALMTNPVGDYGYVDGSCVFVR